MYLSAGLNSAPIAMGIEELQRIIMNKARMEMLSRALDMRRRRPVTFYNVAGSAAAVLLSSIKRPEPVLVVGDSLDDAGYLYHDLTRIVGEESVLIFPSGYKRAVKYGQVDPPSVILRTEALSRWSDGRLKFVVTYPDALAEQVASKSELDNHTMTLKAGTEVDLVELQHWLRENNFVQVDYVYEPGQWALRGSILDIFGYAHEYPFRVDFFGDEIESIRKFNIETQLSDSRMAEVTVAADVKSADGRGISLLDFVPDTTVVAMRDAAYTIERIKAIAAEGFSASAEIAGDGDRNAMSVIVDADAFARRLGEMKQVYFTAGNTVAVTEGQEVDKVDMNCSPQGVYHKNFDLIADSFTSFLKDQYTIYILSDSEKQITRLHAIFEDRGMICRLHRYCRLCTRGLLIMSLVAVCLPIIKFLIVFINIILKVTGLCSGKLALSLKELQAIEPGDYIVHIDHGVGKFGGLVRTDVNGRVQEMIKLIYKNNDIIFVSIHALHKLSKYRGKEGVEPQINKIGSGAWNRVKEKTKAKLKDIARDLIKLYAARKDEKGYQFSPDSYMQQELEASFIYEDTPDQLTATQAVKADMESERPMDRLVCGDVGFGKTEVAIRAAFKAAVDGKQVAVLVPTTVLAYQHYNTFKDRLKDFPVNIEYLSRARTAKQTKDIVKRLAEGQIDILIGTHRIIGKDVKFKDLGLLVVDEEQKFGVAVKERLKQLKVNVDTLTMSATPIPRTLQFSLMGARDLSAITTPPANRYPILTSVNTLTDDILAEAVNFEMSRNGQVFIINNRIEQLYDLEAMVKRVVPDARTLVAHGQMPPEKLEKAVIDFANHDYDVLLATTIIESGIDMPNVNTIIVNNAHCFGLSALHQLRGRVGRSSRKAFCYLMVPPGVPLTPVARRRLQAIESFSDLGSGIHIAMQDLDIRGAGNLLGAEQSGFIADLGYEAYQRILKEAVLELRNEEFADVLTASGSATVGADNDLAETEFVADCTIESDMELLLPAGYVPNESERISLYQELDNIEREIDLRAFADRLIDRFGPIPDVTAELLRIPRLRRMARSLGVERILLKQGRMFLYFVDESNKAYYQSAMFGRLLRYLQENPRRVSIREKSGKRSFVVSNVDRVEQAVDILQTILSLDAI